jgi:hypothetical protein
MGETAGGPRDGDGAREAGEQARKAQAKQEQQEQLVATGWLSACVLIPGRFGCNASSLAGVTIISHTTGFQTTTTTTDQQLWQETIFYPAVHRTTTIKSWRSAATDFLADPFLCDKHPEFVCAPGISFDYERIGSRPTGSDNIHDGGRGRWCVQSLRHRGGRTPLIFEATEPDRRPGRVPEKDRSIPIVHTRATNATMNKVRTSV